MGIYKRGNVYYARFQVRGKTFNLSTRTSDKAAAIKLEKTVREREQNKVLGIINDMPLADAISIFVKYMKEGRTDYKPDSIKRYNTSFRMIASYITDEMISSVDKDWVAGYVAWRRAEKKSITNRTLRRDLDALSLVFQNFKR